MKVNQLQLVSTLSLKNRLLNILCMTTIIKFQHISKTVTAKIVLTYEEDKKEVSVEFFGCKDELGDKLLIAQIDGKWATDSIIARKFRVTYLDILNEINWMCAHHYTEVKVMGEFSAHTHLN